MIEEKTSIKSVALRLLNAAMSFTAILVLLVVASVGSILGAVLSLRLAIAGLALAVVAIGLALTNAAVGVVAVGQWAAMVYARLTDLYIQGQAVPQPPKAQPTPKESIH